MTQNKQFTERDMEVAEDIASLKTTLEIVKNQGQTNEEHIAELNEKMVINQVTGEKILEILNRPKLSEKVVLGTGAFIAANWKTIVGVALLITTGGLARALDLLQ